jgi:stage V sporulation protein AA
MNEDKKDEGKNMPRYVLYMKCDANVESTFQEVYLKDVASLQCADKHILAKCKCIKVWHFTALRGQKQTRVVISALKLVKLVEEHCPGVEVVIVGETDVVLEYVKKKKQGIGQWLKIIIVCLVCFFGTAFTIMAYHNDVGIRDVFSEVYEIVTQRQVQGINPLEISYSVGLAVGILVFFNHVGNLKLTKDPTPIEVSMKNYERDVNQSLTEIAGRNGEEVDV